MRIAFDMDGTIANLYGDSQWLVKLLAEDPSPYANATPLVNMSRLARLLNKAQANGHEIVVVSWLCKNSRPSYDEQVTCAKLNWLKRHLASVQWNEIHIVSYGTPKSRFKGENGILFDDELPNRNEWGNGAYTPNEIFEILKGLQTMYSIVINNKAKGLNAYEPNVIFEILKEIQS